MTTSYPRLMEPSSPAARLNLLTRKPQRVTSTLSWQLHQRLQERADEEGRSLSNLFCHLLESCTR